MPRSTIKPEAVEIKRKSKNGYDLLIHWDIRKYEFQEEMSGELVTEYIYKEEKLSITYRGLQSELESWIKKNQDTLVLKAKAKADDLTLEEKKDLIDYETGKAIDNRLHAASGIEEQIGIIRDLLVQNINDGLLNSTVEFDGFNKIAVEEINESQTRKENL